MANYLVAEIGEEGIVRIKTPGVKPGDKVRILADPLLADNGDKGKWSEIEKGLSQIDELDFPRLAHDEILRNLNRVEEVNE